MRPQYNLLPFGSTIHLMFNCWDCLADREAARGKVNLHVHANSTPASEAMIYSIYVRCQNFPRISTSTTTASAVVTRPSSANDDARRIEWYAMVQGIQAGNACAKCLRSNT